MIVSVVLYGKIACFWILFGGKISDTTKQINILWVRKCMFNKKGFGCDLHEKKVYLKHGIQIKSYWTMACIATCMLYISLKWIILREATSTAAIVLLIPPPDLVKFSCSFIFSLDFMDSFVAHSLSFLFVIVLSNLLWLMASYPFVIFRHSPQFMVMSSRCKTTVLDITYETSFFL